MKFQKIAARQELIQKLFNVIETFLNYFEYATEIFFNTDLTKIVSFPKTTGVSTNKISIVLEAHFYISD